MKHAKANGKATPVLVEEPRMLRLPGLPNNRHMKVSKLSTLRNYSLYTPLPPQEKFLVLLSVRSRRDFTVLLLCRAAIFSHKELYSFQDCQSSAGPEGRDGTAVRSRRVSSTQAFIGRV
jgi:hypothetical protein